MVKRVICAALVLFSLLFAGNAVYFAKTEVRFDELNNCRRIAAYSGYSSAFFYGCQGNTLYSFRVLPTQETRYVTPDSAICALSHDEYNAYALCRDDNKRYSVCRMNIKSGKCTTSRLNLNCRLYNLFAAANGEMFVVTDGQAFSYVIGINGNSTCSYEFSGNIKDLFVNAGSVYALIQTGDVYRLKGGTKTYCCNVGVKCKYSNAGTGYIYSEDGRLISLDGSAPDEKVSGFSAKVNGVVVQPWNVKLFASARDSYAVMNSNGSCVVETVSEQASGGSNLPTISDGVLKIAAGTTVSVLKSAYSSVTAVYNSTGTAVSSGLLKTGYSVDVSGKRYTVVVPGDVNGNGKIVGADVTMLMKFFIGSQSLTAEKQKAADYNGDGNVDNKDLLLISRMN